MTFFQINADSPSQAKEFDNIVILITIENIIILTTKGGTKCCREVTLARHNTFLKLTFNGTSNIAPCALQLCNVQLCTVHICETLPFQTNS